MEVFCNCVDQQSNFQDEFELLLITAFSKIDKYLAEGCISTKFDARLQYYHRVAQIVVPIYKYILENIGSMSEVIAALLRQLVYMNIFPRLAYDFERAVEN
jgi:hypothetical protein